MWGLVMLTQKREAEQLPVARPWRTNRNWKALAKVTQSFRIVVSGSLKLRNFIIAWLERAMASVTFLRICQHAQASVGSMKGKGSSEKCQIPRVGEHAHQASRDTKSIWKHLASGNTAPRAGAWVFVNTLHAAVTCFVISKGLRIFSNHPVIQKFSLLSLCGWITYLSRVLMNTCTWCWGI